MIKKGFSLIEVLVVVAVIAVVAVFVVPSFLSGNHTADLNGASQQIASSLREAQSQSAGQVKGAAWGVHFSNSTNTAPFYAVFSGTSYATGTTESVYRLPDTLGFVTSTLPLGSSLDVTFSPASGGASVSTTIQLYVLSQPSLSSTVTIGNAGQIAFVTPTTPAGVNGGGPPESYFYVVDSGNNRVEEFSAIGTSTPSYLSQFSTSSTLVGALSHPEGIAIDSSGNMWIADTGNNRIVEITHVTCLPDADCSPFYFQFSGSGADALSGPSGVAIDSSGNIWVADTGNNRVEEFSSSGTLLNGSIGAAIGATQDPFDAPQGVAIDSSGNIWVADTGDNCVVELSSSASYLREFCASYSIPLSGPSGIAIDSSGNIWVTNTSNELVGDNRVVELSSSGTYLNQFLGSGGDALSGPYGVAIGSNIWVADTGNNRIVELSSSASYLNQFGSAGSGNGELSSPSGIAVVGLLSQ